MLRNAEPCATNACDFSTLISVVASLPPSTYFNDTKFYTDGYVIKGLC